MIKKEKKILQVDKVPVQYIKGDFCNTTTCTNSRISDCTKCLEFILNVTIYSNIYQTLNDLSFSVTKNHKDLIHITIVDICVIVDHHCLNFLFIICIIL